jgi:hypothetical protein
MVYPLQHENEAFVSHTNPCISRFWHGLLSPYMKMKPFSPIQMHTSPFLGRFTLSIYENEAFFSHTNAVSPIFGEVYPLHI